MTRTRLRPVVLAALALSLQGMQTAGAQAIQVASAVQITGSRFGETVQELPMSISVVTGDEMRARGATDLRAALALVPGVSVAAGGDGGPAAAVPSLLGVREIDDLLLLIDGVPAGSLFMPQVEAISLVNVERIEVLRGAAPVYFGTTAFAGTINVIHYAAGKADAMLRLSAGSHASVAAGAAFVLSDSGYRQSASIDLSRERYADARTRADSARGSWRGAGEVGGGQLRTDINLSWQHQKPASPTAIDQTRTLTPALPVDFNANPDDAKIDTSRAQFIVGYELPLAAGRWGTLASYTETRTDSIRGFLDLGDTPLPWSTATVADVEAYAQNLRQRELFIDTHYTFRPLTDLDVTAGLNLLAGTAHTASQRYAYTYAFNGSTPPPAVSPLSPKTLVTLNDERRLLGLYAQGRYKLTPDVSVLGGLRWNDTQEKLAEQRITTRTGALVVYDYPRASTRRASGSVGLDWQALRKSPGALNDLNLYASYGNTFQLPQPEFTPSPESRPEGTRLLAPETQKTFIVGAKGDAFDGALEFDVDGFFADFGRQPVEARVGTTTVQRAEGQQRFRGLDFEARWHLSTALTLVGNVGFSDARYRDTTTYIDGATTQLAGKRQILTPRHSGTLGLILAPARGLRGSLTVKHTGAHYLDEENEASQGAYTVVDLTLGWRFDAFGVNVSAFNVGDRRPATQASELGEGTFYRLPGRRLFLGLDIPL